VQYTYDGRGNLQFSSLQPTGQGATTSTFAYDARNNLTQQTTRQAQIFYMPAMPMGGASSALLMDRLPITCGMKPRPMAMSPSRRMSIMRRKPAICLAIINWSCRNAGLSPVFINDPGLPNDKNQPNPPPNDGSNPGDKPNLDPYRLPYPLPPNEPSTSPPVPLKGIALGLSDNAPTLPRTYYLSKFFSSLNSKLRPQGIRVYLASEWYRSGLSTVPAQDPNFPKALNDAETRAWHIYFNLEGFAGDPVQLAEKSEGKFRPREYTDSELYTIRHNPDFCAKTTFYTSGSNSSNMGEDVSGTIKQSICGL